MLRERLGAEVAIVSGGLFQQGLPSGIVTLGDLNDACFSTANPCLTEVRGEQILAALERGLDPNINETRPQGYRGTPVGVPQIRSGLSGSGRGTADAARGAYHFARGDRGLSVPALAGSRAGVGALVTGLVIDTFGDGVFYLLPRLRPAVRPGRVGQTCGIMCA